jgi:hypothetical protein
MAVREISVHLFDAAMRGVVVEMKRVCGQWP